MTILLVDDDEDDRNLFIEATKEVDSTIICHSAFDGMARFPGRGLFYAIFRDRRALVKLINLRRKSYSMIEKSDLEGILKNSLSLTGCSIKVKVSKSTVTLTGRVYSTDQKDEAERIAWKAIGVWTVGNELVIAPLG